MLPLNSGRTSPWSVVCTYDEPDPLILAFVAYYRYLGADHIHLYLDNPDRPVPDALRALSYVEVTVCDDAFWARMGGKRYTRIVRRQVSNAFDAYQRSKSDWLLHVDADEFLSVSAPLAMQLAAVPRRVDALSIAAAERTLVRGQPQRSIFDGLFRRPVPPEWAGALPERLAREGLTNGGFTGHRLGKTLMRTRREALPGIHRPRAVGDRADSYTCLPLTNAALLHFDGLTQFHWTRKLLRLARNGAERGRLKRTVPVRYQHLCYLDDFEAPSTAVDVLFDEIKTLSEADIEMLAACGLIWTGAFPMAEAIEVAGFKVDVSASRFDAALGDAPARNVAAFSKPKSATAQPEAPGQGAAASAG